MSGTGEDVSFQRPAKSGWEELHWEREAQKRKGRRQSVGQQGEGREIPREKDRESV